MFNDENQEDVTLENDVTEESVEEESEVSIDPQAELERARAEAKKWEAIAKRNAKKVEKAVETTQAPVQLDEELIQITYKNHLSGLGLTDSSIQDEAIALAKRMGVSLAKIQDDPALMEVLKTKQKQAVAQRAVAGGTGGATVVRNDTNRMAAKITQGGSVKEDDISGAQALEMLGIKH